jgi:hypothetical protein
VLAGRLALLAGRLSAHRGVEAQAAGLRTEEVPTMRTDDGKRPSVLVLVIAAAVAVVLVAAVTAWTAWLGGAAAWPLVLAPLAVVLAVP